MIEKLTASERDGNYQVKACTAAKSGRTGQMAGSDRSREYPDRLTAQGSLQTIFPIHAAYQTTMELCIPMTTSDTCAGTVDRVGRWQSIRMPPRAEA